MSSPAMQTMETFFECFGRGDIADCCALMRPDVVVHEPAGLPYGGEYHGPDGFAALIGALLADHELTVNGTRLVDAEDKVIVLIDATFEHRATGRRADMRAVELYTVKDERIADIDVYYWDPETISNLATRMASPR